MNFVLNSLGEGGAIDSLIYGNGIYVGVGLKQDVGILVFTSKDLVHWKQSTMYAAFAYI